MLRVMLGFITCSVLPAVCADCFKTNKKQCFSFPCLLSNCWAGIGHQRGIYNQIFPRWWISFWYFSVYSPQPFQRWARLLSVRLGTVAGQPLPRTARAACPRPMGRGNESSTSSPQASTLAAPFRAAQSLAVSVQRRQNSSPCLAAAHTVALGESSGKRTRSAPVCDSQATRLVFTDHF